jgi:hypothetical protein
MSSKVVFCKLKVRQSGTKSKAEGFEAFVPRITTERIAILQISLDAVQTDWFDDGPTSVL